MAGEMLKSTTLAANSSENLVLKGNKFFGTGGGKLLRMMRGERSTFSSKSPVKPEGPKLATERRASARAGANGLIRRISLKRRQQSSNELPTYAFKHPRPFTGHAKRDLDTPPYISIFCNTLSGSNKVMTQMKAMPWHMNVAKSSSTNNLQKVVLSG